MSRSFREGFQPIKSKANDPRRSFAHDDSFAIGKRGDKQDAKREARRQEKRNHTHFYSL